MIICLPLLQLFLFIAVDNNGIQSLIVQLYDSIFVLFSYEYSKTFPQ